MIDTKMRKIFSFLTIALLTLQSGINAQSVAEKEHIVDSLYNVLVTDLSARDSIRTLYNIFDLSPKNEQANVAWQLYRTAGNADDINVQIDMIRNLAVLNMKNDSIIAELLKLCDKIPNNDSREATRLFVGNQQMSWKSSYSDPAEVQRELLNRINSNSNLESDNIYRQIEFLFDTSQFLSGDTEGALFREIFDKYEEKIAALPASDHPLKSQFYTNSAIMHTRDGSHHRAVEADREVLKIIGQLEQYYRKKKRLYRNYDRNKYVCYRRMLFNYQALSEDEVRAIRDSINALYYTNRDVRDDMDKHTGTHAAYYMAIKEYDKAIPAIKNALKDKSIADYQRTSFYRMLREAAKKTGDRASLIYALEHYDDYLESKDSLRQIAIERESMIRERIDTTSNMFGPEIRKNIVDSTYTADNSNNVLMIVSGIIAFLLIVYMVLYFRLRTRK